MQTTTDFMDPDPRDWESQYRIQQDGQLAVRVSYQGTLLAVLTQKRPWWRPEPVDLSISSIVSYSGAIGPPVRYTPASTFTTRPPGWLRWIWMTVVYYFNRLTGRRR